MSNRSLIDRALTIPNLQKCVFFACKSPKKAAEMVYVNSAFREVMLDEMFQSFFGALHILMKTKLADMNDLTKLYQKLIDNKCTTFFADDDNSFPIKCGYRDHLGDKLAEEQDTFEAHVNGLMTLEELKKLMLSNLSPKTWRAKQFLSSSCFTFVEVEDGYRIENLQIMNADTCSRLAGAATHNTDSEKDDKKAKVYYDGKRTVAEFFLEGYLQDKVCLNKTELFRIVDDQKSSSTGSFFQLIHHGARSYDFRPYPELDNEHQVYCVWHGSIHKEPWRVEHDINRCPKLRPPALIAIPNTHDVFQMLDLMKTIFNMKESDFNQKEEKRQVWMYVQWALHYPDWKNKMKDFFFYNKNNSTRPKAIVLHHCDKEEEDMKKDQEEES